MDGTGDLALQLDPSALLFHLRICDRDRGKKRLRIGMERMLIEFLVVGIFNDAAEVHDGNTVGDVADHGEVMGDKDVGKPCFPLKIEQQIHDLRLNGNIQCGDRFVADHQRRTHGQRAGDANALALAAGEFMREAVGVLFVQPDLVQQLDCHFPTFLLGEVDGAVQIPALRDEVGDGHARVQARIGILKDHLDAPRKLLPETLGALAADVPAVEEDASLGRIVDADDRAPER